MQFQHEAHRLSKESSGVLPRRGPAGFIKVPTRHPLNSPKFSRIRNPTEKGRSRMTPQHLTKFVCALLGTMLSNHRSSSVQSGQWYRSRRCLTGRHLSPLGRGFPIWRPGLESSLFSRVPYHPNSDGVQQSFWPVVDEPMALQYDV